MGIRKREGMRIFMMAMMDADLFLVSRLTFHVPHSFIDPGIYRWHILDPIRFDKELSITIQYLGWRYDGRYCPQKSDIVLVMFWYQRELRAPFPKLSSKDDLEMPKW